jgi:membrane-bound metal-dependent hydrolase YbcI (DUF457 family)
MNTQTHILMGALLFGRKIPKLAWAGAAGGVIPDLPMYAIVGFLRATGHDFEEIFGRIYWEHWWQVANAVGHNFALWCIVCIIGWSLGSHANAALRQKGALAFALGGSALVHSAIDFLCHRNDAHMHFWPFTQWRFVSPVSYWDPAFYGTQFSLFEAMLGLLMAILLFRIFKHLLVRSAFIIAAIMYVAVPAFFFANMNN